MLLIPLAFTSVSSKNPPLTAGGTSGSTMRELRHCPEEAIILANHLPHIVQKVWTYAVVFFATNIPFLKVTLLNHGSRPHISGGIQPHVLYTLPFTVQKSIYYSFNKGIVDIRLAQRFIIPRKPYPAAPHYLEILRLPQVVKRDINECKLVQCHLATDYLTFYKTHPIILCLMKQEVAP